MDMLDEIKGRLGKAPKELFPGDGSCMGEDFELNEHTFHYPSEDGFGVYVCQFSGPAEDFYIHATADIAWLLGEVERLRQIIDEIGNKAESPGAVDMLVEKALKGGE